jgi:hypothetical protein
VALGVGMSTPESSGPTSDDQSEVVGSGSPVF